MLYDTATEELDDIDEEPQQYMNFGSGQPNYGFWFVTYHCVEVSIIITMENIKLMEHFSYF